MFIDDPLILPNSAAAACIDEYLELEKSACRAVNVWFEFCHLNATVTLFPFAANGQFQYTLYAKADSFGRIDIANGEFNL